MNILALIQNTMRMLKHSLVLTCAELVLVIAELEGKTLGEIV